jgi:transcriptional antiterminator NusG
VNDTSSNESDLPEETASVVDSSAGESDSTASNEDAANEEVTDVETTEEVNPVAAEVDTDADAEATVIADVPKVTKSKSGPVEETPEIEEEVIKDWYILKVQSNREKSICANLIRRVKIAGLEEYFDEIIVPTEDLVEYKNGKKRVSKRKLYPGYIIVHMAINDDTWFMIRETGGIGDFTGTAGHPTPMLAHEVERIVKQEAKDEVGAEEPVKTNIRFKIGEHVRITEGTFENFEGDVDGIDETNGRVTVMINIFGRTTPVEMEHWQMEPV